MFGTVSQVAGCGHFLNILMGFNNGSLSNCRYDARKLCDGSWECPTTGTTGRHFPILFPFQISTRKHIFFLGFKVFLFLFLL